MHWRNLWTWKLEYPIEDLFRGTIRTSSYRLIKHRRVIIFFIWLKVRIQHIGYRVELDHLLDNKIIFLNGPPAIGKSIRVFSLTDHQRWITRNVFSRSLTISTTTITTRSGPFVYSIAVRTVSMRLPFRPYSPISINRSTVVPLITCKNRSHRVLSTPMLRTF